MSPRVRQIAKAILTLALVLLVALSTGGIASGKKKGKRLRLTCEQTRDAIERTAQQYRAQYIGMGWPIGTFDDPAGDGISVGEACKYLGGLSRQGKAFMAAERSRGGPPFPGDGDDRVFRYLWAWTEVVTRTKKGRIRTSVSDFRCFEKVAIVQTNADPRVFERKAYPCASSIPPDVT